MKIKYFLLILIPIFIILINLQLMIFNYDFYEGENKEVNENLLNYFKGEELEFEYTEREMIHLQDVKSLINTLKVILYILGFLILLILVFSRDISKILIISGLIGIGIVLILFLFNFSSLFTKFHEILFTNDYWLLPKESLLIRTYPLEFFIDFFKRLVLNIIILNLIIIGLGLLKNVHTQHKFSTS